MRLVLQLWHKPFFYRQQICRSGGKATVISRKSAESGAKNLIFGLVLVGVAGFEPTASKSQTHSERYFLLIFRHFHPFPRKPVLSGTLISTVSVCSGRSSGINCGQKMLPRRGETTASGEFCHLYGNSNRAKSQGLSQTNFAPQ